MGCALWRAAISSIIQVVDLGISRDRPVTHGRHREPLYLVMNRGRYEGRPASVREAVRPIVDARRICTAAQALAAARAAPGAER